jgi:hypothetical protein
MLGSAKLKVELGPRGVCVLMRQAPIYLHLPPNLWVFTSIHWYIDHMDTARVARSKHNSLVLICANVPS